MTGPEPLAQPNQLAEPLPPSAADLRAPPAGPSSPRGRRMLRRRRERAPRCRPPLSPSVDAVLPPRTAPNQSSPLTNVVDSSPSIVKFSCENRRGRKDKTRHPASSSRHLRTDIGLRSPIPRPLQFSQLPEPFPPLSELHSNEAPNAARGLAEPPPSSLAIPAIPDHPLPRHGAPYLTRSPSPPSIRRILHRGAVRMPSSPTPASTAFSDATSSPANPSSIAPSLSTF